MPNLLPTPVRGGLERVRDEIQETFDRWTSRMRRRGEPNGHALTEWSWPVAMTWPTVDVEETDDEVIVTAELPGLDRDDFKVEVTGERLLIRGEKRHSHEEKRRGFHRTECAYGSFARAIALPCAVKADEAKAKYRNGELRLRLPKTERAKARQIRVEVN